ncbi:MAG: ATP-binding protein [Acidimicrobiia bacterium]|nr:ATP-binding protein [Acidimicrobiia bacterium]
MSQRLAGAGGGRRFLGTIAGKITLRMLLVAAIPVLAVGALTVGSLLALADRTDDRLASNRADLTEETIGANRADQARLVLSRMSAFVDERISDTIDWSRAAPIVEAAGAEYPELAGLAGRSPESADSQFEPDHLLDASGRSNRWLRTQTVDQPAFVDALITDASGFTVGSSGDSDDFTNADHDWFAGAWDQGVFLGPAEVDEASDGATFVIAVRIHDPTNRRPLGVLKAVVDTSALQVYADEVADASAGVGVRVMTSSGLLLAETESGHDPSRISTQLTLDDADGEAYAEALGGSEQSGPVISDDSVGGFSRNDPVKSVSRLDVDVPNHDWVAFVEQPASSALEPLDGLESLSSDLNTTARVLIFVVSGLVVAAMGLAYLLARLLATRIARPINHLRVEANRLADRELPELVSSLNAPDVTGEIPVVTPIRIDADGEVAELASAFNSVRSTAVELAAAQAIGRTKDVSNVLLNLGRRNQQLVGRQLRFIDDLERSESDPDALRNLFLLDQMATRMRRNAESLLVLAGEDSPRRVSHARPIEEVVRAATGEVEDYARVRLASTDAVLVQPNVVNDIMHLLAELIENATNFSPPEEPIEITGVRELDGSYTLSIVDRGVGMGPAKLREANDRLSDPIFAGESTSSFLGLFVVGRLAARHGIDARLVESAPSGITALVTLPPSCVADIPEPVGEMTSSRLSRPEPVADSAASWPAPAITHPRPARGGRTRPAAAVPSATESAVFQGELTETTSDTADSTNTVGSTDTVDTVDSAPTGHDEAVGDTSPDGPDGEAPFFDPRTTADLPALAVSPVEEDQSAGRPIPPFRARESKLPVGVPDGDDGRPAADPGKDRFRVRKRVRRHQETSVDAVLEPVPVAGDDESAELRAAEVRDKLNRFASGVRAAKDGAGQVALDGSPDNDDEADEEARQE